MCVHVYNSWAHGETLLSLSAKRGLFKIYDFLDYDCALRENFLSSVQMGMVNLYILAFIFIEKKKNYGGS